MFRTTLVRVVTKHVLQSRINYSYVPNATQQLSCKIIGSVFMHHEYKSVTLWNYHCHYDLRKFNFTNRVVTMEQSV